MRRTISPSSGWPGRISLSRRTRSSCAEKIADQTVLQRMRVLATNWKKLRLNPDDQLADYGGALNLLECAHLHH
jgi:hypothetical protein